MPRKFFYLCAGMFLLALSYHFGASTATAQASGSPVVAVTNFAQPAEAHCFLAVTAIGDAYVTTNSGGTWVFSGNVFSGPTPALHESWGQLKSRYRATPSVTPGTTVTPGAEKK